MSVLLLYMVAPPLLAITIRNLYPDLEGSLVLSVVVITLIAIPIVVGLARAATTLWPQQGGSHRG